MVVLAVWLEDRRLSVREIATPQPQPGETTVRVALAGICSTDLELVRGYYPYRGVPGHEFVGIAESGPLAGKRVVGEINAVCGECATCRAGRPTHCERRTVLGIVNRNGALAEFLTLPTANLHQVPDSLADEVAVFTEPLAAALEIQNQIAIAPGDRILVVGDGKLGQLIARTLALRANVTVVGRHEKKLALLHEAGIATLREAGIRDRGYDIVVECTGNQAGFALARRAVRPRGTLVMKSTYAGDLTFNASALVVDEITLVGSRCGPFEPALALLASGTVDVRPLIDARYPLRDAIAAFDRAQESGVLKVVVEP